MSSPAISIPVSSIPRKPKKVRMNHVEVICEIEGRDHESAAIESFALLILDRLGIADWQMGLVMTDNDGIRQYNRDWRDKDVPTDVLSFVQDDGEEIPVFAGAPKEAGDVIISLEKVAENAGSWENSYDEELRRVIIHGILHLNGMDHPGDDYSGGMLKLQEEILADTGRLIKNDE